MHTIVKKKQFNNFSLDCNKTNIFFTTHCSLVPAAQFVTKKKDYYVYYSYINLRNMCKDVCKICADFFTDLIYF